MKHSKYSMAAVVAIAGVSSTASANTLVVEPTSENVVIENFEYRYDAVRRWVGCWQYDILQGSGWYPSAWYHTAEMTYVDGDYQAKFQPTLLERYCAAEMTYLNYVQIVWTDPNDASRVYRGVMQIDARGATAFDEVSCVLADPESPYNAIECERAYVNLSARTATIVLHIDGLE